MEFDRIKLHGNSVLDLPLVGAKPSDSYQLKLVDGLGPPDIDVIVANQQYAGKKPQSREIVFRIELNPNYALGETAGSLREKLYGLLVTNVFTEITEQYSKIELLDGNEPVVYTNGYVKKFEIVPFTKDQEVQITYSCPDPYLLASEIVEVNLSNITQNLIQIYNPGSALTGMYWQFRFLAAKNALNFYGPQGAMGWWVFLFDAINWAVPGMKVELDTRPGHRYSSQIDPDGTRWNNLQNISPESTGDWPMLAPGWNTFITGAAANTFVWERIWFRPQYWGV